jgi:hypothetical protein
MQSARHPSEDDLFVGEIERLLRLYRVPSGQISTTISRLRQDQPLVELLKLLRDSPW